jgi:hypothetical protein
MDRLRADGHQELVKVHGTPVGPATVVGDDPCRLLDWGGKVRMRP